MIEQLAAYNLSTLEWMLIVTCGILIGMSKSGLVGAGLFIVPIFATVFGGKPSVGIVLPMLIFADIFAVKYYNRHAEWKHIFRLVPWAFGGIILGFFIGKKISDVQFNYFLSVVVIVGIVLMIWDDLRKKKNIVPDYWWFSAILGLTGGFISIIGNAAGPIMSLYLLSMRLPKNSYIGTRAWFFFIINVIKLPFLYFGWEIVDFQSLSLDLFIAPGIVLGIFLGIKIVKLIPEKPYRIFIIVSTLATAIILLNR